MLAVIYRLSVNSFANFHNYDCKQCTKLYQASNKFKIQPMKDIIRCNETQEKAASYQGKHLKTRFLR